MKIEKLLSTTWKSITSRKNFIALSAHVVSCSFSCTASPVSPSRNWCYGSIATLPPRTCFTVSRSFNVFYPSVSRNTLRVYIFFSNIFPITFNYRRAFSRISRPCEFTQRVLYNIISPNDNLNGLENMITLAIVIRPRRALWVAHQSLMYIHYKVLRDHQYIYIRNNLLFIILNFYLL